MKRARGASLLCALTHHTRPPPFPHTHLDLDFVFHMFFLVKYAKALEEASFRGRAADFLWMLLLGGAALAAAAPLAGVQFLGSSLAFMMVYVWSRRNRHVSLSFLGILTFTAPYLPWVLLALSSLLRSSAAVDVLGMGAGECVGWGEGAVVCVFRVPPLPFPPSPPHSSSPHNRPSLLLPGGCLPPHVRRAAPAGHARPAGGAGGGRERGRARAAARGGGGAATAC